MKPPVAGAPAPRRSGGRPKHEPTDKQRAAVNLMVACGIDQDTIAGCIGITDKTLQRHYRRELDTAYAMIKAEIGGKLIDAARKGDVFAQVFYMKTHGWSERIVVADGGVDEVDLTKLTDGEIAARLARLRRGPVAVRSSRGGAA